MARALNNTSQCASPVVLVNAEGTMIRAKYNYVFTTNVLKFYYGEDILLD